MTGKLCGQNCLVKTWTGFKAMLMEKDIPNIIFWVQMEI